MKKKIQNQLFSLDTLTGNWESVNLNPTVLIYRDGNTYSLSIIHINETSRQASPATYEIQEDEAGYYIRYNAKRMAIDYDAKLDLLNICVTKKERSKIMDVLNSKSETVVSFFTGMDEMINLIGQVLKNRTPHLNGEKLLTGKDVCTMLHISPRTLQEWRSKQVIPFIQIEGKILYRQRDIGKMLAEHRISLR
jgi:hypothetical protein